MHDNSNLTGKIFGRLKVIEFAYSKNNYTYWKCLCNCGNITYKSRIYLKRSDEASCGCYKKEKQQEYNKSTKTKDLTGQKFNRLTAIRQVENNLNNGAYWLFKCDCGNEVVLKGSEVVRGKTRSCGCLAKEIHRQNFYKHGLQGSREYQIWTHMKIRCNDESCEAYKNYGGRGITYDPKWETFEGFWEDMHEGYENHLTIERIDVNGNYCKENCTWITKGEQGRNRRDTLKITYKGIEKPLAEWAEIYNIPYATLRDRYHKGWKGDLLFSTINYAKSNKKIKIKK